MSAMNITPLVDVMLVMLVIFMVTAPVFSQAIPLPLGGKPPLTTQTPPPPIELRIDAAGEVFLAGQPVPVSALSSMFSAEIERGGTQLPSLKIDASGDADYQVIARVLATAQNAGLGSISFKR
ncbi:MAG: biopolymer transporter ExbD [Lysobacter sp.]|nr:biopolymer transporter ExbD [Lysobacter sp.]